MGVTSTPAICLLARDAILIQTWSDYHVSHTRRVLNCSIYFSAIMKCSFYPPRESLIARAKFSTYVIRSNTDFFTVESMYSVTKQQKVILQLQ